MKGAGGDSKVASSFRFFANKGCFVSLQVTILVLAAQTVLQYSGLSISPKRWRAAHDVGSHLKRDRNVAALQTQVANTIWTPQCQSVEDEFAKDGTHPIIDLAVASECNSRSRRDAIRKGWGSFAKTLGMRWRFFVGLARGDDKHCETSISAEARRFKDIVILPLIDTYENLTQKALGMMTYTAKCSTGDFYAKTDDDVFVYPWRLQQRLKQLQNDSSIAERALGAYVGNFWIDAKPITAEGNKNYEGNFVGGYYPPYAGGPFYILSRPAIEYVLLNARSLNWKWRNEDMSVGTWMVGMDIKIVQEWKIKLLNWKHHERPFIAEHHIDSPNGVEAWHLELHANFSHVGA